MVGVQSPKSKVQSPTPAVEATGAGQDLGSGMLTGSWMRRTVWALGGAAVWVAMEMVQTRIFGGFPWDLLGVSQYQMTPLIQIASITGVYGVSFLVVWVSLALLSAGLRVIRQPTTRSVWMLELFLPLLAVAILFNWGWRQVRQEPVAARFLKVTLAQPSIPQTLIWDPTQDEQRFRDMMRLSEQALTNQADLMIWPESAIPRLLRYDTNTYDAITGLARTNHVWMIVGSDDVEPHPGEGPAQEDYFNSSFLVSPRGNLVQRYVKRNLVIFGEYIPLERWLPFLKYFTPIQGGFTPGTHAVPFELKDLGVKTSVLICFEDIFPQLGRSDVQSGTDFLVNLTNDGWFDESAAQWQQAATALFRTVENRVPLIRCSNNGLTCWVDAQGRLRQIFRDQRGSIYGRGFLTVEIPLLTEGGRRAPTFYCRHGDWFGWACVAVAGLFVVAKLRRFVRRSVPLTLPSDK